MNCLSYTERAFECSGAENLACRGVITEPSKGFGGRTVVWFPAGIKYRSGPGGLHVHFARKLAEYGVRTVRLDLPPLGECCGTLERGRIHEIWNTIEQGRFLEDGREVLRALAAQLGQSKFVLAGLCGGAATAQMIAACHPELADGLLQLNPAITFSQAPGGQAPALGNTEAKANLSSYLNRLASPESWARALGGISDYRSILLTLQAIVKTDTKADRPQLSPFYHRALETTCKTGIPQLYVMSGNDQRWFQFQDLVLKTPLARSVAVHVIPGANHELHWPEWRASATEKIAEWLGSPR